MDKPEYTKKYNWIGFLICFLAILELGKLINIGLYYLVGLKLGEENIKSYLILDSITNYVSDCYSKSSQVLRIASDPDIKFIASRVKEIAKLYLDSGIESLQETKGAGGFIRGFFIGFTNPMFGIRFFLLSLKNSFSNIKEVITRLQQRYGIIVKINNFIYWIILVIGNIINLIFWINIKISIIS